MARWRPNQGHWDPLSPAEVARLFRPAPAPWWIAGGYSIGLFVGHSLRAHGDIDVMLLRRDQQVVHDVLIGWERQAPAAMRR